MKLDYMKHGTGWKVLGAAMRLAFACALSSMMLAGAAYASQESGSGDGARTDMAPATLMTAQDVALVNLGLSTAELSGGASHSTSEFFQAAGAADALSALKNAKYASFTNLGALGDATDTTSVYAALDFIRECNALRAAHGLPELKVTDRLMAIAESDVNWSDTNYNHSQQFYVGENLAWGYSDPFAGWYVEEKRLYDQGGSEDECGHYLNIVNGSYKVTGFAISRDGRMVCHGQVFDWLESGETAYTVDEWQARFDGWRTTVIDSMYRMYNPNSGEHFYTASTSERDGLVKAGWRYEGVGWKAPNLSSMPVYRLYSGTDHHYTTSVAERDNLVKVGWKYEGVGWYSDDAQGTPLYRQFNPNVQPSAPRNNSGSHNYTTSKAENDGLVRVGWRAEGIGWYGVK